MSRYIIGIDLAKLHDYTAVTVLDVAGLDPDTYVVRNVYRYPIGLEYNRVAKHIMAQLFADPYLGDVTLVVDATGLGGPVLEQFRGQMGLVIGLSITAGQMSSRHGQDVRVPKIDLISNLLALVESGRIFFAARAKHLDALMQELMAFQGKMSDTGYTRYEGRGAHDDMVMSLAMAAWYADRGSMQLQKPMVYTW